MGLLEKRNDSATVRTLLPEIEAEVEAGAKRPEIYEALKKNYGLTLSYDGFLSALKRARRYRKERESREAQRGKLGTTEEDSLVGRVGLKSEKKEPPAQEKKREAPKKKRGIISPEDFRPSPEIEEEIERLSRKKYE